MQIDLSGSIFALSGERTVVADAIIGALQSSGATAAEPDAAPDILLVSLPLLPHEPVQAVPTLEAARQTGEVMRAGRGGRIVFLLSATAGLPARRHPDYSVQMAAAQAGMRTLAMQLAPEVLVNAVGAGCIGDPSVAGEAGMLSHAAVPRPGTIGEVVGAALFFCDPLNTYTTGQTLNVDGGWSVGYGRNF